MKKNKKPEKEIIRQLAHCKMCREPMLYLYDAALRDYCWLCTEEMKEAG